MILIIHPIQARDIRSDPTFEHPITYSEFITPVAGEIGRVMFGDYGYVRVILSEAPVKSAVGK